MVDNSHDSAESNCPPPVEGNCQYGVFLNVLLPSPELFCANIYFILNTSFCLSVVVDIGSENTEGFSNEQLDDSDLSHNNMEPDSRNFVEPTDVWWSFCCPYV